jgi:GTP pyrophosphokinase
VIELSQELTRRGEKVMVKKALHTANKEAWLTHVSAIRQKTDVDLLQLAISLINHTDNTSLQQGLKIADILLGLELDTKSVAAALMYPAFKTHVIHPERVADHFGEEIRTLLMDTVQMRALNNIRQAASDEHHQMENLRKLLLAMVSDIRAVLILLAERLVQLRDAKELEINAQKQLARETISIYAPLANRIGVWQLKWEMEDLCFRYLEPEKYKEIASLLTTKREAREKYIKTAMEALNEILHAHQIPDFKVTGRVKHIYSIYSKMKRKGADFHAIYDITALRVLVPEVTDCYNVLSILQTAWKQIPKEFDDYISQPKPNGYRSLHTLVIGPENQVIEVQIRTHQMHQDAELGVAAHWQYKEGKLDTSNYEAKIALLRQIMAWQNEMISEQGQTKEQIKDLFADRVYVFTPMGDIIDLPQGATSLDFAYHIHSEIGHRCRGAKVDGKMVPLTYQLKTGQRVEVLTSKQHNPSRDWLNPHYGYIKTAKAKSHLQHWFRVKDDLEKLSEEKEHPAKVPVKPKSKDKLHLVHSTANELETLKRLSVLNVSNFLTKVARCCKPLPGDDVIGYITQKEGLSIHRANCKNLRNLRKNDNQRFMEIAIGDKAKGAYPVDLEIRAYKNANTLRDMTAALADIHIHVAGFQTHLINSENEMTIVLTIVIPSVTELNKAVDTLKQLANVIAVHRL